MRHLVFLAVSSICSISAFAAGPDMTGFVDAVDFDTVLTAVLAIAGLLAVVFVVLRGAQIGLAMLVERGETSDAIRRDNGR